MAWKVFPTVTGKNLGEYLEPHQLWKCLSGVDSPAFLFYVDSVLEMSEFNYKLRGIHNVILREPDNRLTSEEFAVATFHEYNISTKTNKHELLTIGDWPDVLYEVDLLKRESSLKLSWQVTKDPTAKSEGTCRIKDLLEFGRIPQTMSTKGTLFWIMDKVNFLPCKLMDLYKMYVQERLGMTMEEMKEREGGNIWTSSYGPYGYQGLAARLSDLRRLGWVGRTSDGLIGLTPRGGRVYRELMLEGKYEV